ncbi:MAG: ABC transporter permease subunit [Planctomycetes bacterium]|nr:ABC transporter permease subunit [Planctomycetota bacterium]
MARLLIARIFRLQILAFAAVLLLSADRLIAQDSKPLKWGADREGGAPYIFPDPRDPNRDIGFEVDLVKALEKELGRPIVFEQYEFEKLTDGVQRGDIDFALNGLEITPDRAEQVLFSKPYYAFRLQLVQGKNEDRFTSLQGLKDAGGTVGTLANTAASRYLEKRGIKMKTYSGQVEPYKELAQGVVDGVLLDQPIAQYYAKKSQVTPEDPPLRFADPIIGRGYYAIAFKKGNDDLKQEFDAALTRLFESGKLREIYQKWNLWTDGQEEFLPSGTFLEHDQRADDDAPTSTGGYFGLLLQGAWMTVKITFASFALAVLLALPISLCRMYGPGPIRWLATGYIEFFRGIPVILVLIFLYYGLPEIAAAYDLGVSLKLDAFTAAVVGLGISYAAYEAEIYRAGIGSIPDGQWEAADSLGMSKALTFRRIILPQAIRVILPPMTNDLVALFKDSAVVSLIAVVELSKQYMILTKSDSRHLVAISLATATLYLLMSVPLGFLSRYLESRWSHG